MKWLIAATLIIAVIVAGYFWINRPQYVSINADLPRDFPAAGFSHDTFEHLLGRYVDAEGRVNYDAWHESPADRARLDHYLAAVSAFSPDTSPERFPTANDRLVYWIQAYNAYVIRSVLEHWPLDSVTDVEAPIEAVQGLGFFYRLRYSFGGAYHSLYEVEHDIIRERHRDPRIHFVLNCASDSCPVLRPELPGGDELESLLAEAAADFVSETNNVSIDHERETVTLSRIFKWYRKDFINDLRRRGVAAEHGLIDYVASVAPGELRRELETARGYDVRFFEYDWDVNAQ